MKERIIRAVYDENTITVYQAYRSAIAIPAVKKRSKRKYQMHQKRAF